MGHSTRQWCCATLLSLLITPPLLSLWPAAPHDCADHVCPCARRDDAARERPRPCHGASSDTGRGCEMRARCAHGTHLIMDGRLYLPQPSPSDVVRIESGTAMAAPVARLRPGVLRVESPPPKHS